MQLFSRFRSTLAYLLLIVFSLVALPKELWHHCEYPSVNIQSKNNKQAHVSVAQELCPICAIQIALFISPTNWDSQVEVLVFHPQTQSDYAGQKFTVSRSISLRGPPLA